MLHDLKCVQPFFNEIEEGRKPFEIRFNDRNYRVGDTLRLHEFDREAQTFSGRTVVLDVTYLTDYEQRPGYVVMAVKLPDTHPIGVTADSVLKWGLERMTAHNEKLHKENQRLAALVQTYEEITDKANGSPDAINALKAAVFQASLGGEGVHEAPKDFFGRAPEVRGL